MNTTYSLQEIGTNFMYRVYGWMAAGLGLTASTAYWVSTTTLATKLITNSGLFLILMLVQLGLVIGLSFFIDRMSYSMAALGFMAYSLLTGVTLSSLFLIYTQASLVGTFIIAAGMFAAMAVYGYFTKADLTTMGSILFMALIGLIIGFVVNIFLKSSAFNTALSAFGVLIFAGLTAYDVQRIKQMSYSLLNQGDMAQRVSILGALTLYLDFLNLFLSLLSFTGKRRD
ncbi:Bax inhibitor-1/YccA family protein [Candidatus Dependentiae bacterium]|nr:Bax inhibitor-1/YccA family protein [Candidatus Dependentiae bacterium]